MEVNKRSGALRKAIWLASSILMGAATVVVAAEAPKTDTLMLSGTGPDDAVQWEFSVDGGMRAGETAKIAVPSNWQTQGFGHYQYGYDKGPRAADKGTYRRSFTVPADWKDKNVRIVFDAVMTDTRVRVNGESVGPVHQGGFNRFSYDITKFLKVGDANTLEVEVSEASANTATDIAERHGDYWVFGGIYRPVWLEAAPAEAIAHLAIDGQADGDIVADVALRGPKTVTRVVGQVVSLDGKTVGAPFSVSIPAGGAGKVRLSGHVDAPKLWTAETPNLYYLDATLYAGDTAVHTTRERFGFRTFEIREGDGLYVNGQRVMMKGVVRHTFRPETGRAITREQAYEDARLIKSMNMNAMRVAHYPPDKAFLEAADELGLYVIDELSGWQKAHDTENGRKLVRSLVERDVNHPSILIWSNGNEGGWNSELDSDFALYDPQARPVIHPWAQFGGIDTKHYPRYPDLMTRLGGKMLVLPTEFLHGLFDGGHGSGLDDYWKAMTASKNGAGGFLWVLADEGVKRTDQNGRIDNYAAYAPDGIVGPHHEKEPSFDTIRDIWSPVQIDAPVLYAGFTGALTVRNGYDFTSLSDVTFKWEWVRFAGPDAKTTAAKVLASGTLSGPAVAPHGVGDLSVPLAKGWQTADALRLTASKGNETLLSWVWPTNGTTTDVVGKRAGTPKVERTDGAIRLVAGKVAASFDPATGLLTSVSHNGKVQSLSNGPRLVLARPKDKSEPTWLTPADAGNGVYSFDAPTMANTATIDLGTVETDGWASFKLEVSPDGKAWKPVYEGGRVLPRDGLTYSFAPQPVKAIRISNLAGVRQTPKVVSVKLAYEAARYAVPEKGAVTVTAGSARDATGKMVAWVEAPNAGGLDTVRWTLREDGTLALDYAYQLNGLTLYHGIGFDRPLADVASVRALVRGPTPVWQNRLRGPVLGVWDVASRTGKGLRPETAGYFADPHWVKLTGVEGKLTIRSHGAPFVQIGAKPEDFPTTTVEFPHSDIGFMQAIPAMGAKFQNADLTGPQGQPAVAQGTYSGRLLFEF